MTLPSTRPYFLRALCEWCADHGFTPYLTVKVDEHTMVPQAFVKDGQITFNISGEATQRLQIENDSIHFEARFGGVAQNVFTPIANVIALFARENGVGMQFEFEKAKPSEIKAKPKTPSQADPSRSHLKIVK